ncbi:MAG: VTT domain-containing protein [Anaerolineales bacterium]|nr:VTT domain-containing protein [Anaerolineales bacterium]
MSATNGEIEKNRTWFNRKNFARVIALLVTVSVSLYIFSIRDQVAGLGALGYPGIFLISLLAYATVFLPAPGVAVVFTMGAIFHPFWVAIVAGAGAALGEFSGYIAGFGSQLVIEKVAIYHRLTGWMQNNGPLTILVLSAIPNPFFDLAGITAGALKMHPMKFLFWVWLGVTVKMLFFSYAGFSLLDKIF